MEEKSSYPQQQQFILNLKHLPPIDPPTQSQMKKEKQNYARYQYYVPKVVKTSAVEGTKAVKKFDHEANTKADFLADKNLEHNIKTEDEDDDSSGKDICPNNISNSHTKVNDTSDNRALQNDSGVPNRVSAKSQLHEACSAIKWKPPLFQCCSEEGPGYNKLFTYKVMIESEELSTVLECFGGPRSKKKTAAEHAAEGALWYLKHLGYIPIKNK